MCPRQQSHTTLAIKHFTVGAVQVHIDLSGSSQPGDLPDGILPSTLGDMALALILNMDP